jgi:glyoxylase-like metal-dependent hydrolase (beta-lactamase superfamily II)
MTTAASAPAAAPALQYPFAAPPGTGTWTEIAEGVRWIRMPLPFALDHINLWLLRGPNGWTIVDSGFNAPATRDAWAQILPHHAPLEQLVVTHYHPDHMGHAGWFVRTHGLPLTMTEAEYLTAHALYEGTSGYGPEALRGVYGMHGLPEETIVALEARPTSYRHVVTEPPRQFRRMTHGDVLRLGNHDWQVIVGYGHSPEHASLYCEALRIVISGDMLLPKISTNVSVWSTQPEGDPVRQFLTSIRAYLDLPEDTLVLPSHGLPFRGIAPRVAQLTLHHEERLAELLAACDQPRTAAEIVPVLFRRPLDTHQTFFAVGEAIAHLNHLMHRGKLERMLGPDGVYRFAAHRT